MFYTLTQDPSILLSTLDNIDRKDHTTYLWRFARFARFDLFRRKGVSWLAFAFFDNPPARDTSFSALFSNRRFQMNVGGLEAGDL